MLEVGCFATGDVSSKFDSGTPLVSPVSRSRRIGIESGQEFLI